MEVESVLVTGANRGIGFEFVRQLVQLPNPPKFVFATYRNRDTASALLDLRNKTKACQIIMIKMDITIPALISNARKIIEDMVGDNGLNLLINNAGVIKTQGFPQVTEENLLYHFRNNTMGPIAVIKEMLPLLQKSANRHEKGLSVSKAAVLNISSVGGSMLELYQQPREAMVVFGYRVSKATLNMAMRIVAAELKDEGILVVQMCPGWVKTDMSSGPDTEEMRETIAESNYMCQITPEESISAILKTLSSLNDEHQGSFMDRNGQPIPF